MRDTAWRRVAWLAVAHRLLALFNNARNQQRPHGLLAPQTPGIARWLQEFAHLVASLQGRLSQLLASADDDDVAHSLAHAEPDLLWNFLVEAALNANDDQRATLRAELSPGLALVQVLPACLLSLLIWPLASAQLAESPPPGCLA
eukprot:COSAG01_NODE_5910_length_3959_cov_2.072539_3_plen_145_part_00